MSDDPRLFFPRRHSLSTLDGCFMYGDRVVIPERLRKRVLNGFHIGHPGVVRMKALARSYVCWPKIDDEIEEYGRKCEACQFAAKLPPKSPQQPWPKSKKPWQRLHLDFADPINGKMYLIVVDSYSK